MRFSPHEFLHVLGGQAFSGEASQEGSESLLRLLQSFARLSRGRWTGDMAHQTQDALIPGACGVSKHQTGRSHEFLGLQL